MVIMLQKFLIFNQSLIKNIANERVDKFKYLGVFLSNKVIFKDRLNILIVIKSRKINFLKQIRNGMKIETKITLYKT